MPNWLVLTVGIVALSLGYFGAGGYVSRRTYRGISHEPSAEVAAAMVFLFWPAFVMAYALVAATTLSLRLLALLIFGRR